MTGGIPGAMRSASSIPFCAARGPSGSTAPPRQSARENGSGLSSNRPASTFEKSRMSLMTSSRDSAELWATSRYSRWLGSSLVPSASSSIPSTPFIGVRISWLMLARNSLFARLAASAASRAPRSASCALTRSVTSMMDESAAYGSADPACVRGRVLMEIHRVSRPVP